MDFTDENFSKKCYDDKQEAENKTKETTPNESPGHTSVNYFPAGPFANSHNISSQVFSTSFLKGSGMQSISFTYEAESHLRKTTNKRKYNVEDTSSSSAKEISVGSLTPPDLVSKMEYSETKNIIRDIEKSKKIKLKTKDFKSICHKLYLDCKAGIFTDLTSIELFIDSVLCNRQKIHGKLFSESKLFGTRQLPSISNSTVKTCGTDITTVPEYTYTPENETTNRLDVEMHPQNKIESCTAMDMNAELDTFTIFEAEKNLGNDSHVSFSDFTSSSPGNAYASFSGSSSSSPENNISIRNKKNGVSIFSLPNLKLKKTIRCIARSRNTNLNPNSVNKICKKVQGKCRAGTLRDLASVELFLSQVIPSTPQNTLFLENNISKESIDAIKMHLQRV